MASNKVHSLLEERGIPFEVHTHPRAVEAQRLAAAEGVSGWEVAKPVLLSVGGQLAMAVVPASVNVDLEKASDVLGHSEVRLADEDEFVSVFTDCEAGAEPPFGNLYGVPVFLEPKKASPEGGIDSVGLVDGAVAVRFRNDGNTHLFVKEINIAGEDSTGARSFSRQQAGWYVLAGATPIPIPRLAQAAARGHGVLEGVLHEEPQVRRPGRRERWGGDRCLSGKKRTRGSTGW